MKSFVAIDFETANQYRSSICSIGLVFVENFQLIDYGTNRGEKNGKAFALWINDPAYVTDKPAFVNLHLIPADEALWTEDKFEDFIEKRADLILVKLTKYTTISMVGP